MHKVMNAGSRVQSDPEARHLIANTPSPTPDYEVSWTDELGSATGKVKMGSSLTGKSGKWWWAQRWASGNEDIPGEHGKVGRQNSKGNLENQGNSTVPVPELGLGESSTPVCLL